MIAWLKRFWKGFEGVLFDLLVRKLHLPFLEDHWEEIMRFVRFGFVGLSNTFISYVIYLIGIALGMNYLLASILGFVVSVVNAFYWNNKYVFEAEQGPFSVLVSRFVKTFLSYAGTGLVFANILLVIQVQYLGLSEVVAPLINLLITIPLNYVLNKLWAFSAKKKG